MLEWRIESQPERTLVGISMSMSLANNRTAELWRSFMPRHKEIKSLSSDLFALRIYDRLDHPFHDPKAEFVKWASVEADAACEIPEGMSKVVVPGGLYAVFHYKGLPAAGAPAFQYIFNDWLPKSGYQLDLRPHFELLGEKYNNASVDSEEDIYLPIYPPGG